MRKRQHLMALVVVMVLLSQLLAACDSGSPTPTAVKAAPTSTAASKAVEQNTTVPDDQSATPIAADTPAATEAEVEAEASPTPLATFPTKGSNGGDSGAQAEWTVLIYSDADDPVLEGSMLLDLSEAEFAGSSDHVNIVAQIDRLEGTSVGLGNWSGTRRYLITKKPDNKLASFTSKQLDDLGELNMSDPQTLTDFITWGVQTYPAKKYAIILSDHGIGWVGCCTDKGSGGSDLPEDAAGILSSKDSGFGPNTLWLSNIDKALGQAQTNTGIAKFDIVGFDQCLMSQLEVYSAVAPHALYSVASEEVEPALGWAYGGFLGKLDANPQMDGAELSKAIVEAYIDKDALITSGQMPADTIDETTLAAVDLTALSNVETDLDALVGPLSSSDQTIVAESRRYAQSYKSPFGTDQPSSYIDLGNFLSMVAKRTESADVKAAIATLMNDYSKAVIAEKHGTKRPGSTGLSIYFPVEQEYKGSNSSYAMLAERFVSDHQWDEYLQAHYSNTALGDAAAPPADEQPADTTAEDGAPGPGTGDVVIDPIELSDTTAAPGKPVTLTTRIVGDKLAYLYFFVGHIVSDGNLLITDRQEFVPADQTEEEGGVTYPLWPDGGLDINYNWEPQSFALTDGTNVVNATFDPDEYGDTPIYRVEGLYTSAKGGERYALLYFQGGDLQDIYSYSGAEDEGSLTQIIPTEGDTFTPTESGFDLDPNATEEVVSRPANGTLTYGQDGFSITESEVQSGDYVIGFVAEDLDGQLSEQYVTVTVQNP